jgi:Ni,Fe-hydrogenase III component G
MFGLTVDGIPDSRPLVLPDDWPAGNFPLRKDWKHVRPQEVIPGGKS